MHCTESHKWQMLRNMWQISGTYDTALLIIRYCLLLSHSIALDNYIITIPNLSMLIWWPGSIKTGWHLAVWLSWLDSQNIPTHGQPCIIHVCICIKNNIYIVHYTTSTGSPSPGILKPLKRPSITAEWLTLKGSCNFLRDGSNFGNKVLLHI